MNNGNIRNINVDGITVAKINHMRILFPDAWSAIFFVEKFFFS